MSVYENYKLRVSINFAMHKIILATLTAGKNVILKGQLKSLFQWVIHCNLLFQRKDNKHAGNSTHARPKMGRTSVYY